MKKLTVCIVIFASMSVGIFAQGATSSPTPDASSNVVPVQAPVWVAPPNREKSLTLFAPKPIAGDNIFKDEAEEWLAQAILDMEVGALTPIQDKEVVDYVSQVGQNLVKYSTRSKKKYEFVVLNDPTYNAFAIGGGKIFINLGVLKGVESEDELAAIIGHEIGHDAFQHAPKAVTRQMFWMTGTRKVRSLDETKAALRALLDAYGKNTAAAIGESLLGWSRFAELEADKAGFYNMYKAGYNPEYMKSVFRKFLAWDKKDSDDYASEYMLTLLFGSHPPSSQRLTAAKWESNWIKMPKKESVYTNTAFDNMKKRVRLMR